MHNYFVLVNECLLDWMDFVGECISLKFDCMSCMEKVITIILSASITPLTKPCTFYNSQKEEVALADKVIGFG